MALSLGFRKWGAVDLKFPDGTCKRLQVTEYDAKVVTVSYDGVTHHVGEDRRVMLQEGVYVQRGTSDRGCRLAFDAPRSVRIDRVVHAA